MNRINRSFMSGVLIATGLTLVSVTGASAQEAGANATLEEIVVTARRREENLTEVPVAISVVNDEFIIEAGIFDSFDLFDAAVGFEYDTGWGDRNSARPGVRGVQGNGLGVTQQKMNSFLDGFPLVGQQGSLQFDDVQRVELYRGPQSAAFGRATFAGAINYVSRDPGEEFETKLSLGGSDMGRQEFHVALGGPISDTLGFTLDVSSDEYEGPSEWISTDGYHLSATATDYASVKFVWTPSDNFTGKLRYIRHRADDIPGNRYFVDYDAQQACSNIRLPVGTLYYEGDVAAGCDLSIPASGITRNHDVPAAAGLVPGDPNYELALSVAVLEPYARDERDRVQVELDFAVGDSAIQVLAMVSHEYFEAWQDSDHTAYVPAFTGGPNVFGGNTMIGPGISHMANPYDVDEEYIEVRWVSPETERFRYMVGVTDYSATVPGQGMWNTAGIRLGLDGVAIQGSPFTPRSLYGDRIFNTGAFANLSYDISDRTTFTAEARYQEDLISNVNALEGDKVLENETTSFLPRLSITHNLNDDLTLYGQLAQGNNPAGVSIGYTFDRTVEALEIAKAAGYVTYDAYTFRTYVEERLTNMEVGLKGNAFDDRLTFATALFTLDWQDQTNVYTVNWDGPWNDGSLSPGGIIYGAADLAERTTLNEGTIVNTGVEFEGTYHLTDRWSINGNLAIMDMEFDEFCDVLAAGGNFRLPADGIAPGTGVGCVVQDGNTPPNISEFTYNLGFAYRAPLGISDWRLSARMDLRHSGDQWMDTSNIMKIRDRNLVNGSINLTNEAWTVRFWGNNLTDEDLPRFVGLGRNGNVGPSRPRGFRVTPQRPREIGLGLSYSF